MEEKVTQKLPFGGNVQRVHRNIAYQPHVLNQYEEDAQVAKKIIYYLQNKFDRDLFGFICLDPHIFAAETGIDRSELAKLHEAPYQKRIKNLTDVQITELKLEDNFFHTVFENALYRIAKQRIEFTVIDETDPDNSQKTLKLFDFFEEVKIVTNRKNRNKKMYYIKPSLFFAKSLKQYTLINPQKYFELSKGKSNQVGDLYVYLNYVKQTLVYKKQVCFPAHKNLLAKILNCTEFSRDRKKNEVITKYLDLIKAKVPELGLHYEWKPRLENPQYKDYCMISFSNLERTRELMLDPSGREERTEYYFDHHLYFRLILAIKETHPAVDLADFHFKEIFTDWLGSQRDIPVKIKAYQAAYKDLWNDDCHVRYPEHYFAHFKHLSGEFARRTF